MGQGWGGSTVSPLSRTAIVICKSLTVNLFVNNITQCILFLSGQVCDVCVTALLAVAGRLVDAVGQKLREGTSAI